MPYIPSAAPLTRMADGTVKQVNPFTGTEVWTVPGRAHRPLSVHTVAPQPIDPSAEGAHCAFCEKRYLDTPPEKARLVRDATGAWDVLRGLGVEELTDTVAEFRRIPNLFEILSFDYWHANYAHEVPESTARFKERYLSSPEGRAHVMKVVGQRLRAGGMSEAEWQAMPELLRLRHSTGFFGGGHDVIVARRHFTKGATTDDELASSGTLSVDEHRQYTMFTIDAMQRLYADNRYARYVAVFQNWLKPAGASFDHLHKQLVAIDERGVQAELELQRLRANPNMYNELAVDYAGYQNLVVAENEHAVVFAGFGHRYPTLEIYSRSAASLPWEQSPEEIADVSDLLHALHAATGADIPCNEEWHHKPVDVDVPMPWRIMLKWRISNLAGFEGGTKIYLNTLDPWTLRDRVVPRLYDLRDAGRIAPDIRIAEESACEPNSLRYNPIVR